MKSCSNSSNKAVKQTVETKTVIDFSTLETVCDLSIQRRRYKMTEKRFFKKC